MMWMVKIFIVIIPQARTEVAEVMLEQASQPTRAGFLARSYPTPTKTKRRQSPIVWASERPNQTTNR
jgi:hypothetical protein